MVDGKTGEKAEMKTLKTIDFHNIINVIGSENISPTVFIFNI